MISVYDIVSMNSRIFMGHKHNIPGIDFSPNGQFLVSCSIDGSCRVWNVETGDMIADEILSDQWQWTVQYIRKEDLQLISDLSGFLNGGVVCSFDQDFMDLDSCSDDSIESWHTDRESIDSKYYECIEDPKYLSNELILSTSINHIFLSEQYGKKLKILARLDNISEREHLHFDLDRLSIVKWIKELSIAVVASQIGLIGILRIVKYLF